MPRIRGSGDWTKSERWMHRLATQSKNHSVKFTLEELKKAYEAQNGMCYLSYDLLDLDAFSPFYRDAETKQIVLLSSRWKTMKRGRKAGRLHLWEKGERSENLTIVQVTKQIGVSERERWLFEDTTNNRYMYFRCLSFDIFDSFSPQFTRWKYTDPYTRDYITSSQARIAIQKVKEKHGHRH